MLLIKEKKPVHILIYRLRTGLAPQVGLEPTTLRLTAECSAIELLRNIGIRRRPTLPGRVQPSTIGAEGLNFCVRNGNRWIPFAIATGNCNNSIERFRSFLALQVGSISLLYLFVKRLFSLPEEFLLPWALLFYQGQRPDNCTQEEKERRPCCFVVLQLIFSL